MDLHPGTEDSRPLEGKHAEVIPIRQTFQDNEDWFQDLVEHSQDLLCIHDLEGWLLSVNPAPARVLGYTVEEVLRIPMRELIAPEFRSEFDEYLDRIERVGEASGFMAVMTRSGDRRIWEYHNTLRTEGVQSPIVRGMARDVTEQKLAEKLLHQANEDLLRKVRESESTIRELKLFRALVDRSNDSIQVVDPTTLRFLDANQKACAQLGYSREELLALRVFDIAPQVTQLSAAKLSEELKTTGLVVMETLLRRKDGSTFPVDLSLTRVQLEREYTVVVARDIAERKQAEGRLREYERVVEGLEEMIVVLDRDYRYLIANRAFLKYRRMESNEIIGRNVLEQLSAEGATEIVLALMKQKLEECFQGHVVHYEKKQKYPNLGERDLLVSYFPIEGPSGVERIAVVMQDVTEHRRSEVALRRSEESYRMFVSQSSEGIFREGLDAPIPVNLPEDELIHRILHDHYLAECNDAMAAMYGFKSGRELLGRRLTEMVVPDDPRNIELTREFIRSGFRVIDRESHEVDVHGNPKIFLNSMIGTVENGMLLHTWGIQRDVTETAKLEAARLKAEEALRENVRQLSEVATELERAKEKLSEEKFYLEETIDTEMGFGEIIGRSDAVKKVMEKVAKVAPSDATVLLLGETGTGKELMARAVHRLSSRQGSSFIKLNCAAIPLGLLESELFGHEKGAFTGAVARKLGRLELADQGTLFLDEIGEIPLSLQPKLLRVLQDLEFERLGGTQTLKVNFRLLAATNRDLLQSVKEREFRAICIIDSMCFRF
jgi:formate hydrogenlyase transcriptional activator